MAGSKGDNTQATLDTERLAGDSQSPEAHGVDRGEVVQPDGHCAEEGTFELVVLGTGGGPLETNVSGYALKPRDAQWEDGWIALEGGCGIGSLASILQANDPIRGPSASRSSSERRVGDRASYPADVCTDDAEARAIFQAGYLYGFLSAYLVTHAHLDHIASMILSTGSMPAARREERTTQNVKPPAGQSHSLINGWANDMDEQKRKRKRSISPPLGKDSAGPTWSAGYAGVRTSTALHIEQARSAPPPLERTNSARRPSSVTGAGTCRETLVPIYATRPVLKRIERAYQGDLWPELGHWACSETISQDAARGSTLEAYDLAEGVGVQLCPLPPPSLYQRLPSAPQALNQPLKYNFSAAQYPVSHGCTSHGTYESTAFFIRLEQTRTATCKALQSREILFWGDVESQRGLVNGVDETVVCKRRQQTEVVWKVAAERYLAHALAAIFIECSYDAARPSDKLYGHLQPASLFAELQVLAAMVKAKRPEAGPPLRDLPVYITHIKQSLVPHPSGLTDRERIARSLQELEERAVKEGTELGVKWMICRKGDHIIV